MATAGAARKPSPERRSPGRASNGARRRPLEPVGSPRTSQGRGGQGARNRSARQSSGKSRAAPRGSSKPRANARVALNRAPVTYLVLIPTIALLLLGLVMVFSAGSVVSVNQEVGGYRTFLWQLAWACLGAVLLVLFAKIDYHKLGKASWVMMIISIGLLAMVPFIGRQAYGARRWIALGPLTIQPTEIAKFAIIVFAAYALATKGSKVREFKHLAIPVLLFAGIDCALMMAQPDLGSTLVMCFSLMVVLAVAQTKASHLALIGAVGAAGALYFAVSAPYRRARLFSFVNPWKSPRGYGYHVIQSYIALGSGNIKGLGLGMSRQKFLYLPNAHTDFIFAVVGEELGLAGTLAVVCLLALLTFGGLKIASRAPDDLGKILAAGITSLIVIQALVNIGGVTGLLPITGVPLPLVSSGGSSLCVCMACIGILLNISSQSRARR